MLWGIFSVPYFYICKSSVKRKGRMRRLGRQYLLSNWLVAGKEAIWEVICNSIFMKIGMGQITLLSIEDHAAIVTKAEGVIGIPQVICMGNGMGLSILWKRRLGVLPEQVEPLKNVVV